ncbi:uncharacterized protein [Physcomitrium patens]|uniref:uncharacterized protein isoform X2 n=1 Tax=Physcomitrium patens TaxID=3218 RepID=UPI003CCD0E83
MPQLGRQGPRLCIGARVWDPLGACRDCVSHGIKAPSSLLKSSHRPQAAVVRWVPGSQICISGCLQP